MTTEIAIMNKGAVALAADSAVTIGNGHKFYNTANKLFTLSKYHPVGIMIYNNSEFMGYPMETIIKEYRKRLGNKCFDTLEGYWYDFVNYLEKNFSTNNGLNDFTGELITFIDFLDEQITNLANNEMDKYQNEAGNMGHNQAIRQEKMVEIIGMSIKEVIDDMYKIYSGFEDEIEFSENYEIIRNAIREDVYGLVEYKIGILNNDDFEKILDLCTMILTKEHTLGSRTGIVIAGFGEKDMFPRLISAKFMGIYFNKLKCNGMRIENIDNQIRAKIIPFAQDDVISTFMTGIDAELKQDILNTIKAYRLYGCGNEGCIDELAKDIDHQIKDWSIERHINPIMETVGVAPKEELAQMAETLVNLTSFRRQLSMDVFSQSVGGPIDVALITKGDGFIWVKRKHYFDIDKNYHFYKNYFKE